MSLWFDPTFIPPPRYEDRPHEKTDLERYEELKQSGEEPKGYMSMISRVMEQDEPDYSEYWTKEDIVGKLYTIENPERVIKQLEEYAAEPATDQYEDNKRDFMQELRSYYYPQKVPENITEQIKKIDEVMDLEYNLKGIKDFKEVALESLIPHTKEEDRE